MAAVERTVSIDAPPLHVWQALIDVERWPAWATYMRRLTRQDGGPLALGSRVQVTPRGLPGSIWTVTEYDPPRSYTWATHLAPGLGMIGGHVVQPGTGTTAVTLSLEAAGPLAALAAPLLGVIFRRNTRLATTGLKRYCEAQSHRR